MSIYQSTKVAPYVYWLTHKVTGQFYIGYREANLVPSDQDLPIYKSSSDKIDELGFENFDFQILAEFFDGDSAYDFENRTIEVHIKNPLCLNGHYTKDGKNKFKRTGPHSQEAKDKMASKAKVRILSDETKAKIGKSSKERICSDETRAKRSVAKQGENHHNAKTWSILREIDNSTFNIKSLKTWCKTQNINYRKICWTLSSNKFYNGLKVINLSA